MDGISPGDVRHFQVSTATASAEDASAIAEALVGARLAACVQVLGPVQSRYWWDGAVESATEWLCVARTTAARLDEVIAAVARLHHYETPEIVATPIVAGHRAYLDWVDRETAQPG